MKKLLLVVAILASFVQAQTCPDPTGETLRVGVLPVLNTLPTFVAAQEGLFEANGVNVELVPVESARDRSVALQSGQLDIANNDVITTALQAASTGDIKIVRYDMFTPENRYFSIVTGAGTGLETPEALIAALEADEAQIAISSNTVIEYLATKMLREAGYEPEDNDYIEVSAIPVRLEQLAQGTVKAALLPEPLVTMATTVQGGAAVLSDTSIDFVPVALTVTDSALAERPGDVCAYLKAFDEAVTLINSDPEAYRQNEVRIPDPVRGTYTVPQFEVNRVPSEAEIDEVLAWMLETGLLDETLPYEALVDGQFTD